jgi:AraC family transcriptional regulator of adaptative response/methylated-DNA-[protein]-cysteine methyltransferase
MKKTILPPQEIMYNALINKDSTFEGIFFVGVKTTGIFCRPTCPARKPKIENVEYFPNTKDALFAGFRPCKKCHPLELNGESPVWIKELLEQINENPSKRWKDNEPKLNGFEPNRIRRWFKKNHDMTFHTYLRSRRLGKAIGSIKLGDNITQTAYSHGFDSVSGFREAIKQLIGEAAGKSLNKQVVVINRILTPLGPMIAGATEEGLCLLEFADRRMLETQFKRLVKLLDCSFVIGDNKFIEQVSEETNEYFSGKLNKFKVSLVLPGSEFQKRVWNELIKIPFGQTTSYEEIAIRIGNPNAVRAVATANGDNRLAIIVPCHRVIGKDG